MKGVFARPTRGILVLYGAGDFAFNLYWQVVTLYLLFFYIDVLALPPVVAGTMFMVGTLWDAAADLCAGAMVERSRGSYRGWIRWGALPLGIAFVAMFAVPPGAALWALATQIVFRTVYAFTNVPYAGWTARLARTARERSTVAGLRMGFGAAAGALVALFLPRLVQTTGSYAGAAALLAVAGVAVLLVMAWRVPEARSAALATEPLAIGPALVLLMRNRAFVALNLAAATGGAAAALASQSVLYFFRYVLLDELGGPRALSGMALIGVVAVPAWTIVASVRGARWAWLAAGAMALVLPVSMALVSTPGSMAAAAFLIAMQAAFVGFGLAAWTLLPDAIDWGEAHTGQRVEALAYGAFAMVQKVALAGAGFAIGAIYQASGFVAGVPQGPTSLTAIRWLMLAGPALLVATMLAAVLAIPPRRDTFAAQRGVD